MHYSSHHRQMKLSFPQEAFSYGDINKLVRKSICVFQLYKIFKWHHFPMGKFIFSNTWQFTYFYPSVYWWPHFQILVEKYSVGRQKSKFPILKPSFEFFLIECYFSNNVSGRCSNVALLLSFDCTITQSTNSFALVMIFV